MRIKPISVEDFVQYSSLKMGMGPAPCTAEEAQAAFEAVNLREDDRFDSRDWRRLRRKSDFAATRTALTPPHGESGVKVGAASSTTHQAVEHFGGLLLKAAWNATIKARHENDPVQRDRARDFAEKALKTARAMGADFAEFYECVERPEQVYLLEDLPDFLREDEAFIRKLVDQGLWHAVKHFDSRALEDPELAVKAIEAAKARGARALGKKGLFSWFPREVQKNPAVLKSALLAIDPNNLPYYLSPLFERMEEFAENPALEDEAVVRHFVDMPNFLKYLPPDAVQGIPEAKQAYDAYWSQLDALGIQRAERFRNNPELLQEVIQNRLNLEKGETDDPRPLAVVVFPRSDHNGAFERQHQMLEMTNGHRLVYMEAGSEDDVLDALAKATRDGEQPAAYITLGAHANPVASGYGSIWKIKPKLGKILSSLDKLGIDISDWHQLARADLEKMVEADGQVVLFSCKAGWGGKRLLPINLVTMWWMAFGKRANLWAAKSSTAPRVQFDTEHQSKFAKATFPDSDSGRTPEENTTLIKAEVEA